MKKTIIFILLFCMVVLSSCGASDANDYKVEFSRGTKSDMFKEKYTTYPESEESGEGEKFEPYTEELNPPVETTFNIGKCELTADLTSIEHYAQGEKRYYKSKDGSVEYRTRTDNNNFSIVSPGDGVLCPFQGNELTEQALIAHIKDYISAYIDLESLDEYEYKCETHFIVSSENGSGGETREGFGLPKDDTERVTSYRVVFRKCSNGFATSDKLQIFCEPNGDFDIFYYYDSGIDWSSADFDSEKIDESAKKFLNNAMVRGYSLEDITISNKTLVYRNSEIQVQVTANLDVKYKTGEGGDGRYGFVCTLFVSNGKVYSDASN